MREVVVGRSVLSSRWFHPRLHDRARRGCSASSWLRQAWREGYRNLCQQPQRPQQLGQRHKRIRCQGRTNGCTISYCTWSSSSIHSWTQHETISFRSPTRTGGFPHCTICWIPKMIPTLMQGANHTLWDPLITADPSCRPFFRFVLFSLLIQRRSFAWQSLTLLLLVETSTRSFGMFIYRRPSLCRVLTITTGSSIVRSMSPWWSQQLIFSYDSSSDWWQASHYYAS